MRSESLLLFFAFFIYSSAFLEPSGCFDFTFLPQSVCKASYRESASGQRLPIHANMGKTTKAERGAARGMKRLFLLEDDLSLINGLSFAFKKQGFELDVARTVAEAGALWTEGKYDLLVLDVSLPDGSGFGFCKKVRLISKVPIIFLTASDEETSIMMGLDIGGDDYITKPFKLGVLVSRINALLRRAADFAASDTELQSNGIKVLLLQGQAFKNGEPLELTAAEYKLLCLFMQNPGVVLTKEQILDKLWDHEGNYIDNSTLTVYIRRLRMKVEDNPSEPRMLLTVRRMGYKWNVVV